jgi:hypothetical protein
MERKLGYRPPGLVLEDYPHWLDHVAPRLVQVLHSEKQLLEPDRAMQLLSEIRQSVSLAEEAALSPSVGILPKTKEGLNITANRGTGGKTHLDALDEWLLKQYPSFEMDTDVERARAAMQNAIESSGQGNQEVLSTMVQMIKQQQTTLDLLTQFVTKKPTKASASPE